MTDEYMTLAEALATGLPFKHKDLLCWVTDKYNGTLVIDYDKLFDKGWQVQRPKVKIKLWKNGMEPAHFYFAYGPVDHDDDKEVTGEELQQIREIFKEEK